MLFILTSIALIAAVPLSIRYPDVFTQDVQFGLAVAWVAATFWTAVRFGWRDRLLRQHRRAVALQVLRETLVDSSVLELPDRTRVKGRLEGLPLVMEIRRRQVSFSASVRACPLTLDVRPLSLVDRWWRSRSDVLPDLDDDEQRAAIDHAVDELLGPQGFTHLTLRHGHLCATAPLGEELASYLFLSQARALTRLLQACGASIRPHVQLDAADDSSARCPYCRDALEVGEALRRCPACSTVHHRACFEEAGGCTVLGCERSAARRAVSGKPIRAKVKA